MLQHADIFYGSATPQQARLYVRLRKEGLPEDASLQGSVIGPECALAETLPTRIPLSDCGEGPTLLSGAVLPDPVFWSARMPARYRVKLELRQGEEILATEQRLVGIRALGCLGPDFRQEGKRMVLRIVHRLESPALPVYAWKEHAASMFAMDPSADDCEHASRLGVPLAVLVQGDLPQVQARMQALARYAAVTIVVLDGHEATPLEELAGIAPNLLLFQPMASDSPPWRAAPWAQGIMAPVLDPAQFAVAANGCGLPVLAARPYGPSDDLAAMRAACDALQRDLAPYFQCAGYIV